MTAWKTLSDMSPKGKRVLVRVDLNVPVKDGKVTEETRIARSAETIRELMNKGARVIVASHFGRPRGGPDTANSLKQIVPALEKHLAHKVAFASDCVGPVAEKAAAEMKDGDVLLLENTRFHAEEENNDPKFAAALAKLADFYVNDAFSAAHRAHASTEGVAHLLPSFAGRAMEAELKALESVLGNPKRPVIAIVGGAKVSSKIAVLEHLVDKVDTLVIGGGMANTFLAAQGVDVGKSLQEADQHSTALNIFARAKDRGCRVLLPSDGVAAREFKANAPARTVNLNDIAEGEMILDIGPASVAAVTAALAQSSTAVWNGPVGAFELAPFGAASFAIAREIARLTKAGKLISVAGGGDTLAALDAAGVPDGFTYVSTAGGAFLEWLEGKPLPGVEALKRSG
jgi:phosphoglycerate kinase